MCAGLTFAPYRRHVAPARTWQAAGMVDIGFIQRGEQRGHYVRKKRGGHGPCKQGCLVMKISPLNSRFEACIVRGVKGGRWSEAARRQQGLV